MIALGIDVGGSGIKGALVDLEKGKMITERVRIDTPPSFSMPEVSAVVKAITDELNYQGPIGVGFPSAITLDRGIVLTPPTALHYPGWLGNSAKDAFEAATGCPVVVANDADVAGLAEVRFGAGRKVRGTIIAITLGTGVGSGLFYDGHLVPNTELGKVYLRGHKKVAELYMAGRIKEEEKLKWKAYGPRLNEYLQHLEWLFSPELIIIGGGISKKFAKMKGHFQLERTRVVAAKMRNEAGIVGAAAVAARLAAGESGLAIP